MQDETADLSHPFDMQLFPGVRGPVVVLMASGVEVEGGDISIVERNVIASTDTWTHLKAKVKLSVA